MTNRVDGLFKVNIKRLALLTLPTWLRRPLAGALVYAGVSPLCRLLGELRSFRGATGYRLGHSGQVCRLRGVLNDEFDPRLRRVTVEEAEERETRGAWPRAEGRWLMVPRRGAGAAAIHREGFGGTGGYDFWVSVPGELRDAETETRLRAVVNMYKLAGKRFAINYK